MLHLESCHLVYKVEVLFLYIHYIGLWNDIDEILVELNECLLLNRLSYLLVHIYQSVSTCKGLWIPKALI